MVRLYRDLPEVAEAHIYPVQFRSEQEGDLLQIPPSFVEGRDTLGRNIPCNLIAAKRQDRFS